MVRMVKGSPDYDALIALFASAGMDANDAQIEGIGPDGFDEVQRHRDGRPQYVTGTFDRLVSRRPWPSIEFFKQVWNLYYHEDWVEGQVQPYLKPLVVPELEEPKEAPEEEPKPAKTPKTASK